jgi:hypothetical protein
MKSKNVYEVYIHSEQNTRRRMEDKHIVLTEFNNLFGLDKVSSNMFIINRCASRNYNQLKNTNVTLTVQGRTFASNVKVLFLVSFDSLICHLYLEWLFISIILCILFHFAGLSKPGILRSI